MGVPSWPVYNAYRRYPCRSILGKIDRRGASACAATPYERRSLAGGKADGVAMKMLENSNNTLGKSGRRMGRERAGEEVVNEESPVS